jgi:plastocyanin
MWNILITLVNRYVLRIVTGIAILSILLVLFSSASLVVAHAASGPHTWYAQVGVASPDQAIQGRTFLPGVLWINKGDTVVWTVNAGEIHTVTFLKPGQKEPTFSDNDPKQTQKQGGSYYDGKSYFNSGLLSGSPALHMATSYSLTFNVTGRFTYYCLVHTPMIGLIHVRPAGTDYPFSQQGYNVQTNKAAHAILQSGYKLTQEAERSSNNHYILDGISLESVMVMRFFPQHAVIHVGDTIRFVNTDAIEPHTVTFGASQASDFVPYRNSTAFNGTSPLNSGFIGANPHWFGTVFKVKFVKAGTFAFRCDLHDYMGMLGKIVVLP